MTATLIPPGGTAAEPTDSELADRARAGDADALGVLYTRHSARIYNFLRDLVGNEADAEDLMQTTFLQAMQYIGRLHDSDCVRAWLFSIAYNAARMQGRKRRAVSLDALMEDDDFDIESEAPGPEETAMSRDMRRYVWRAARSLDQRQFTVLNLSLRYGFSSPEIAQIMGTSAGNGAVLLHRAREGVGEAVRAMAVTQVLDVCPGLRALVPEGERGALTPQQRRQVERHLRSCEDCRAMADRMTAPAELLSGVLFLPLPATLAARDWIAGARHAQAAARRSWWRRPVQTVTRVVRLPIAAFGIAGAVAVAGLAGGIAATRHAPAPTPRAPHHRTAAPAAPPRTPVVQSTAAATAPPSPAPADESGKTADAVWADMLTATRAAQSYHIAFSTTSLSDVVTHFDMQFMANGDYAGTVTLALASHNPFTVRKVNGTLYAQGAAITARPDLFGLTPDQAAQVGSGWLALTGGSRTDLAALIDRTLSMWGDPHQLADSVFTVDGTLRLAGTDALNGEDLIVLGDDSGSVSVTRFGALPRRAGNGTDTAVFSDFNSPVTVTAPAGAVAFS